MIDRKAWLDKWKERRAKIYRENKAGMSWNDLAKKYGISVTSIARFIKRAKQEAGE